MTLTMKKLASVGAAAMIAVSGAVIAAPASQAAPQYYCNYTLNTPDLHFSQRGEAVKQAQCLLNRWGYNLVVDGSYGPKMSAAVYDFQSKYVRPADGIVGPRTWNKLWERNCTMKGDPAC